MTSIPANIVDLSQQLRSRLTSGVELEEALDQLEQTLENQGDNQERAAQAAKAEDVLRQAALACLANTPQVASDPSS